MTLCTRRVTGAVHLRTSLGKNRPALIISSTSWTPDEDFSILLDADVQHDTKVPNLVISSSRTCTGSLLR